jgi:hypothetical protein
VTLACPACGKTHTIPAWPASAGDSSEFETCDRCGCDLSRLRAILRTAGELLRVAKVSLERGDWELGLSSASRSWDLVHSAHSAWVASLAASALGDIAALERWRRRTE